MTNPILSIKIQKKKKKEKHISPSNEIIKMIPI